MSFAPTTARLASSRAHRWVTTPQNSVADLRPLRRAGVRKGDRCSSSTVPHGTVTPQTRRTAHDDHCRSLHPPRWTRHADFSRTPRPARLTLALQLTASRPTSAKRMLKDAKAQYRERKAMIRLAVNNEPDETRSGWSFAADVGVDGPLNAQTGSAACQAQPSHLERSSSRDILHPCPFAAPSSPRLLVRVRGSERRTRSVLREPRY
jgi:hypothetical protein